MNNVQKNQRQYYDTTTKTNNKPPNQNFHISSMVMPISESIDFPTYNNQYQGNNEMSSNNNNWQYNDRSVGKNTNYWNNFQGYNQSFMPSFNFSSSNVQ